MGWHSQGAVTLPPAQPHPLATLSCGCYLNGPLCHSKRVSAASCGLLHALTLRLMSCTGAVDFDSTDLDLGHGSGAITLGVYRHLFKPDDRAAAISDDFRVKGGHGDGYPHERRNLAPSPGILLTSATTAWRRKATSSAHHNPQACRTSCTR